MENELESDFPAGLASPARRALAAAGCQKLEHVTRFSAAEISRLHGIGPRALKQLGEALKARGLAFAPAKKSDNWSANGEL